MLVLMVRTLLCFVMVMVSIRLMGKRQVGQLQVPELVVAIIISQVASIPLVEEGTPLLRVVVPIFLMAAYELLMSSLTLVSPKIDKLIYGAPSFLMNGGKLSRSEMRRQRVTLQDLFEAMRDKGISRLEDVSCVILETNGHLSIFPKPGKENATAADLGLARQETGVPVIVAIDGRPNHNGLAFYGRDEAWLSARIAKEKLTLSEVFVMTLDSADQVFIVKRSDVK